MMEFEVAVVGAGMAGLGAAKILTENGINFIILEANDHPGGRIETMQINNGFIDLGAQWVHGIDTELYKALTKYDLIHPETSDEGLGIYIRSDGHIIDPYLVNKVDFEIGKILTECENFVDAEIYPKSVGNYLENNFKKWLKNCDYSEKDQIEIMQLYDWHVRFQLIDNCCADLKQLSAKDWGKYSCLGKDGQAHINIKGGYKALIDALIGEINPKTIKYKTELQKIIRSKDNKIELHCNDGKIIFANHVILTMSLGVLKELNLFDFPKEIVRSISSYGFGGMGKVFLLFDEKWWKTDGFQLIYSEKDLITNWTRHISGFDIVMGHPNMLLAWVSHLGVQELEQLSNETVGKQCVDLLMHFLSINIPLPKLVVKTNWITNKWIRGGYSHTTAACDQFGVSSETLSRPVCFDGVPKILIAGEAAHSTHFSTTHGAYESGQEQANLLVNYLNL